MHLQLANTHISEIIKDTWILSQDKDIVDIVWKDWKKTSPIVLMKQWKVTSYGALLKFVKIYYMKNSNCWYVNNSEAVADCRVCSKSSWKYCLSILMKAL